jgi:membrane protein required for colicin V production
MQLAPADVLVLVVLGVAALRGLWIGVVREAFSLAALALAVTAVRLYTDPLAGPLRGWLPVDLGELGARLVAGAGLGVAVIGLVTIVGRLVRRGVRAAGLGGADRLAGAVLGAAEGALLAGVVLLGAVWLLGSDHPLLAGSRSVEVVGTFLE